jgi:hypothetical protein
MLAGSLRPENGNTQVQNLQQGGGLFGLSPALKESIYGVQPPASQNTRWNLDVPETASLHGSTPPGYSQPTIGNLDASAGASALPPPPSSTDSAAPVGNSNVSLSAGAAALPSPNGLTAAANYPSSDTLSNLGDVAAARDLAQRSSTAMGLANNPGRDLLSNAAGGQQWDGPVFAGQSQQVGVSQSPDWGGSPFLPSVGPGQSASSHLRGGSASESPIYDTRYFNAQGQPIATITGVNQRAGGGTVSQPDQGNGGTVEGNVAALNRQYETVRSLNEALAGGRNSGYAGGGLPSPPRTNPFERPGDSRLDTAVRQQTAEQGLERALDPRSGMTRGQRQTAIAAYSAFAQPGIEQGQQQAGLYNAQLGYLANQGQTQATMQNSALRALQEQRQAGMDQSRLSLDQARFGMDQARFGMDKAKAQSEFEKNAKASLVGLSDAEMKTRKNAMEDWLKSNLEKENTPEYQQVYKLYDRLYNRGANQLSIPTAQGE